MEDFEEDLAKALDQMEDSPEEVHCRGLMEVQEVLATVALVVLVVAMVVVVVELVAARHPCEMMHS